MITMKQFIEEYRKFRHLVREELGDFSEEDIMILFSFYLERPQYKNPFAGLETFFTQYSSLFNSNNNPNDDPNDPDFDDDPFSSNTTAGR